VQQIGALGRVLKMANLAEGDTCVNASPSSGISILTCMKSKSVWSLIIIQGTIEPQSKYNLMPTGSIDVLFMVLVVFI
jgi:hypothetical protein